MASIHHHHHIIIITATLHPFYGPLDFVRDYPGELAPERLNQNQSGFPGARDNEWQWDQLGHMQIRTSPQTDNHASTHHSVFTGWMPFLPPNQQRQSTEGTPIIIIMCEFIVCLSQCGHRCFTVVHKNIEATGFSEHYELQ